MVKKHTFKSRDAWLLYRNSNFYVGGSNIGTILGLDPHITPFQFWYNYKNVPFESESGEKMNTGRGIFMEDGIAKWFESESGEKIVKRSSGINVYTNTAYSDIFQVAPDRELFANGRGSRPLLECKDTRYIIYSLDDIKTTNLNWYIQGQYQLGIMERQLFYLAINNGNKELVYVKFGFDKVLFSEIMTYTQNWIDRYILGDDIPQISNTSDLALMYPISEPKEVEVNISSKKDIDALISVKRALNRLHEKEASLKDKITVLFEEADTLTFEAIPIATYKTNKNGDRILKLKR